MEMISVIVPVYNCNETIEECIKSVLNQVYNDWELILVDDGSTDGSGKICDEYDKKYKNIHSLHIKNSGVSVARNTGLSLCCGTWVSFLDSDDILSRDYLYRMYEHSLKSDLVCCSIKCFPKNYLHPLVDDITYFGDVYETIAYFADFYANGFYNSPCNKLYKRDLIKSQFDSEYSLGEDLFFNIEYFRNCNGITVLPDELYYYRFIQNNNTLSKKLHDCAIGIQVEIFERMNNFFHSEPKVASILTKRLVLNIIDAVRRLAKSEDYTNKEKKEILKTWLSSSEWQRIPINLQFDSFKSAVLWKIINTKNTFIILHVFSI